jgi:hypothetical protein
LETIWKILHYCTAALNNIWKILHCNIGKYLRKIALQYWKIFEKDALQYWKIFEKCNTTLQ